MAAAKNQGNGRFDRLEEAMSNLAQAQTHLVQTQAVFVRNQAAFQAEMRELERQVSERFVRIEAILLDHSEHGRILAEHGRILHALPDAIREKIGFKMP
jgi:hypothetical protein